jgi:hypothetical protein
VAPLAEKCSCVLLQGWCDPTRAVLFAYPAVEHWHVVSPFGRVVTCTGCVLMFLFGWSGLRKTTRGLHQNTGDL